MLYRLYCLFPLPELFQVWPSHNRRVKYVQSIDRLGYINACFIYDRIFVFVQVFRIAIESETKRLLSLKQIYM